jgi:hypothetical protein
MVYSTESFRRTRRGEELEKEASSLKSKVQEKGRRSGGIYNHPRVRVMWEVEVHKIEPGLAGHGSSPGNLSLVSFCFISSHLIDSFSISPISTGRSLRFLVEAER